MVDYDETCAQDCDHCGGSGCDECQPPDDVRYSISDDSVDRWTTTEEGQRP